MRIDPGEDAVKSLCIYAADRKVNMHKTSMMTLLKYLFYSIMLYGEPGLMR